MAREAKKDPSEMSVEERLKALYQLQTLLTEIDKIKTLRGELPLEVQDLEDEVARLNTRVEKLTSEVAEISSAISAEQNNIERSNAAIEKYTAQQDTVRNNREYDALNKEIEFEHLNVELSSKKIREGQAVVAAKKEEIAKCKADVEDNDNALEDKKSELDDIIAETKQEEERLREKAKALEITIEPRLLQAFKRIRKNSRNGLGVTYVQRDACGGCFNKIPAQRQLDIRQHKKIIVCEYCGRIMIDQGLAEEAVEAMQTKKKRATKKAE